MRCPEYHLSTSVTNAILCAGVTKNEAVECFKVVKSSTVHPYRWLLELLDTHREGQELTENASCKFQVNSQITSGKCSLFQTGGSMSSTNFSELLSKNNNKHNNILQSFEVEDV